MAWLDDIIKNGLAELRSETKYTREYAFTRASVTHVPYIPYIDFSEAECKLIQEQAAEVLRSSLQNGYKEVAITFNLKTPQRLTKICGDYSSIPLLKDEKTNNLITDESNGVVIVTMHNHPNGSIFSLSDILIFTENPNIKLMNVINGKGEIAFLMRSPKAVDLHNYVISKIEDHIPDFNDRIENYHKNNIGKELAFSDVLDINERIEIVNDCLNQMERYGVYYSGYLGSDEAKTLIFIPLDDVDTFKDAKASFVSGQYINKIELKEENPNGYYENGEDGYEWESR